MDGRDAAERYTRLLTNVAEVRDLLIQVGEGYWAARMANVCADLSAHDAHGLTRLLNAYGGMGGFGDLVLHPFSGHEIDEGDIDRLNQLLASLRSQMYTTAKPC